MKAILKKYTNASKNNRRTTPLFMMFFLILAMIFFESMPSKVSTEQQWAASILLNDEYTETKEILHLWAKQPSIALVENNGNDIEWILKETVMQIDSLLYDTKVKGLNILDSDHRNADIQIYHTAYRSFSEIAKQHGFSLNHEGSSHLSIICNDKNEIEKAVILLASDQLVKKKLQHACLKTVTQSLGFSNESKIYPLSIFYSQPNFTTTLSKNDQHLIRFSYANFEPGMKASKVRSILNNGFW